MSWCLCLKITIDKSQVSLTHSFHSVKKKSHLSEVDSVGDNDLGFNQKYNLLFLLY